MSIIRIWIEQDGMHKRSSSGWVDLIVGTVNGKTRTQDFFMHLIQGQLCLEGSGCCLQTRHVLVSARSSICTSHQSFQPLLTDTALIATTPEPEHAVHLKHPSAFGESQLATPGVHGGFPLGYARLCSSPWHTSFDFHPASSTAVLAAWQDREIVTPLAWLTCACGVRACTCGSICGETG